MKETVHSIGNEPQLVGVLTQPDEPDDNPPTPVVILVNSGLLGRIGPFRLHVTLARRMAKLGFRTFRVDLSGIGDSGRHKDKRSRDAQHMADINATMDYFQAGHGAKTFIVMGICTGADHAHKAILHDDRVVGAVCIDGYAYPTVRYKAALLLQKALTLSSWTSLLRRSFGKTSPGPAPNELNADGDLLDYRWELPAKARTRDDYRRIVESDRRMLCVFTSAWPYSYSKQLSDAFRSVDFGDNISSAFLKHATHTFKVHDDRNRLIDSITEWLCAESNAETFSRTG